VLDGLKSKVVAAAVSGVAAVFAALALWLVVYAVLAEFLEERWAAAVTAIIFAVVAGIAAAVVRGRSARPRRDAPDEEHHAGHSLASLRSQMPAQLMALARRKPALALGAGVVATYLVLRRPGLLALVASNLLGMRVQKRKDERRGLFG
jgi:small-conductance mechanosensitive channel